MTPTVYITDGLKCQPKLAQKYGLVHHKLDHSSGEYSRKEGTFTAHTNTIDGEWGRLKAWLKAKHGINREHLYGYIKEWQWRRNHRDYQPAALIMAYLSTRCKLA